MGVFTLLAWVLGISAATAQQSRSPQSAFEYFDALLAIDSASFPAVAEISGGTVFSREISDCWLNAPVRAFSEGIDQRIENGEYVFTVRPKSAGRIVLGIFAPTQNTAVKEQETDQSFVVIDEIVVRPQDFRQTLGQAGAVFKLARTGNQIRLVRHTGKYSICREPQRSVSSEARNTLALSHRSGAVWLTSIQPSQPVMSAVHLLSSKEPSDRAIAVAYSGVAGEIPGVGRLVLGGPTKDGGKWRTAYATSSVAATWDQCKPSKSKLSTFKCSGDVEIELEKLLPPRKRLPLFGLEPERFLRFRVSSVPSLADIYLGSLRQGSTNTSMDVRADDVLSLKLEKAGYRPCPYGDRWTAKIIKASRPIVDATCVLQKVSRGRSRRRSN